MDFAAELNKISFINGEADLGQMYDFIESLEKSPNQREAIPSVFSFFEQHFDKDFGSPGPLVHFLEEKNDYIGELKVSIERKPTGHTVWMINRVLNEEMIEQREFWLSKLSNVSNHPDVDSEIRKSAEEFLEYQTKRVNKI